MLSRACLTKSGVGQTCINSTLEKDAAMATAPTSASKISGYALDQSRDASLDINTHPTQLHTPSTTPTGITVYSESSKRHSPYTRLPIYFSTSTGYTMALFEFDHGQSSSQRPPNPTSSSREIRKRIITDLKSQPTSPNNAKRTPLG